MKIMIASDLHGSAYYTEKTIERLRAENAGLLVILGDVYNHGPRNPFPKDYNPNTVADILNENRAKLIVVKGNCDSQVDAIISQFDFVEDVCVISGGKTILCTHGHVYNKDNPPSTKYDAVVYGHFHTGYIERIGGTVYANAGSVSLPKNGTPASYIVLEEDVLTLKDLDGSVIKEERI